MTIIYEMLKLIDDDKTYYSVQHFLNNQYDKEILKDIVFIGNIISESDGFYKYYYSKYEKLLKKNNELINNYNFKIIESQNKILNKYMDIYKQILDKYKEKLENINTELQKNNNNEFDVNKFKNLVDNIKKKYNEFVDYNEKL